jgi:hypothetical protein
VEAFRAQGIYGQHLLHVTDAHLLDLGIELPLKRQALLAQLQTLREEGVPDARMGIIRASIARREQQAREQQAREREAREQQAREELRTWMTGKGLSQSILTDAGVDLRGKGLGDDDMRAVALLTKFNASLNTLYLGGNKMGSSGQKAIRSALKNANL